MTLDLDEDEAAFSIAIAYFERGGGEPFLVVGTGVKATLQPKGCKEGYLRVYAIKEQGRVLEFLHKVSGVRLHNIIGADPLPFSRPRPMTYRFAWLDFKASYWQVSASL